MQTWFAPLHTFTPYNLLHFCTFEWTIVIFPVSLHILEVVADGGFIVRRSAFTQNYRKLFNMKDDVTNFQPVYEYLLL